MHTGSFPKLSNRDPDNSKAKAFAQLWNAATSDRAGHNRVEYFGIGEAISIACKDQTQCPVVLRNPSDRCRHPRGIQHYQGISKLLSQFVRQCRKMICGQLPCALGFEICGAPADLVPNPKMAGQ